MFNAKEWLEKHKSAVNKLYARLGFESPDPLGDMERDYLTVNETINGREVLWYLDEANEVAIFTDTLTFLTADEIANNFS